MGPEQISVERLDLDTSNPRIAKAGSQREALQRILDDQKTKLAVLAEDIAENGLNPTDRWIVMQHDDNGHYIVLEGNRRLAAIKLLNNPAVLRDLDVSPSLRKRFESLAAMYNSSTADTIDCHVVADRTEAERWIQQRHTGENGGKGIAAWSGLAAARFRGDNPALQALDFVLEHGHLSAAQRANIESRFPKIACFQLLTFGRKLA